MTKKVFIISGCQRSGTTLLNLMMSVHPEVHMTDEDEFTYESFFQPMDKPIAGYKLPAESHKLDQFVRILTAHIFWIERDALDVVSSMEDLMVSSRVRYIHAYKILLNKYWKAKSFIPPVMQTSWVHHPSGYSSELYRLLQVPHLKRIYEHTINPFAKVTINQHRNLECRINCLVLWELKRRLKTIYCDSLGKDFTVINYEQLINEPLQVMEYLCDILEIAVHPKMLEHHKHKTGMAIGNTDRSTPLLRNNSKKYLTKWKTQDIETLKVIAQSMENL